MSIASTIRLIKYGRTIVLFQFFACALGLEIGTANAAISYTHLTSTNRVDVLLMQGQFDGSDDPKQLAHELDTFPTKFVAFYSTGGDRSVAMKFGRMVRGLGLTTLQIKGSTCIGTCLMSFFGGVERFAEPGSILLQQSSFLDKSDEGQGVVSAAATAEPIVKQYLSEMGVDPALFDLSQADQSNQQHFLADEDIKKLRVATGPGVTDQSSPTQAQTAMANSEAASTASEFYRQFNNAWSATESASMTFLQNSYADTVTYYGKTKSAADVLMEKKTFAERWPARLYAARTGSVHATCTNTCSVFGIVDWYASSSSRQKTSSGAVNFALVWNPTTGKILAETGKIFETDKNPTGPDRVTRRWIVDGTACRLAQETGIPKPEACQSQISLETGLRNVGWCNNPGFGWQSCRVK